MKKENIALGIFLAFIVGAGVYYSSTKTQNVAKTNPAVVQRETRKVTTNNIPATTTSITPVLSTFDDVKVDTSDWQVYKNEKYGYEFKYPKGWFVNEIAQESYVKQQQVTITDKKYPKEFLGISVKFVGEAKDANVLVDESRRNLQEMKKNQPWLDTPIMEYKVEKTNNDSILVMLRTTIKEPATFDVYIIQGNKMFKVYELSPAERYHMKFVSASYGIAKTFQLLK